MCPAKKNVSRQEKIIVEDCWQNIHEKNSGVNEKDEVKQSVIQSILLDC